METEGSSSLLRDLLSTTKDGDWGKDSPENGYLPYRVIRGTDFPSVRGGDISSVPLRYLKESTIHRRTLEADDILLETAGGSHDQPTGRSLLLTKQTLQRLGLPVTCASFARFLRVDRQKAEPSYIYWYLQHLYAKGEMAQHQVQHTGVARFQYTKFAETLRVPLPSRHEQSGIAHILGSLDDKIELNRRMNETLEAIARALFKSWFVDFDPVRAKAERRDPGLPQPLADLFPDSLVESELGKSPRGWVRESFADTIEILNGGTPQTAVPEYWDGAIPWFSVVDAPRDADVWVIDTQKKITEAGIENSATRVLPAGTTIVTARGTVGKVALVGLPMAMNQSCYGLRGKSGVQGFFTYFMAREQVASLQRHAHGSVFDTITRETLAGVGVVVPPATLIEAFEELVFAALARIRSTLFASRTLAALRDTLLPKLISGQLRIKDAERFAVEASA